MRVVVCSVDAALLCGRVHEALDAVVQVLCSVTSGLSPSKHQMTNATAPTVMHHPVSDNSPGV